MEQIVTSLDLGEFTRTIQPLLFDNSPAILLAALFISGFMLSLNPCMLAILPLIFGGNREINFKRPLLFTVGFLSFLMIIGFLAAGFGQVFSLPTLFWNIALGLLYLITGLYLLGIRLPIKITGFYVGSSNSWLGRIFTKEGLNPWVLGGLFALSPSPCTTPVILAISSYAIASGNILFSILGLGFYGLGHSILLTLAFLPNIQRLFRMTLLSRATRPALSLLLIGLAIYLLAFQPELLNNTSALNHIH